LYDSRVARRRSRFRDQRGLAVTNAATIAQAWVTGSRRDLDRAGALAAITSAAGGDADILAEAAAFHAVAFAGRIEPRTDAMVALLFDAGADREAFERHCRARREAAAQPRFDLATFADQQNEPRPH
jgi:hypothetical protein